MSKINASGKQNLPNTLQNQQTDVNDNDASHIICGKISEQPTWTSDQIHVKGNLILESGSLPSSDHIISQDNSCSITCNNGGQVQFVSNNIDMGGQFIQNCQPIYYNFIYTTGKISVGDPVNIYSFDIEDAQYQCDGSGSQFGTIKIQAVADVQQWSSQTQFAKAYDNSGILQNMLIPSGDSFIVNNTLFGFFHFKFVTTINYCYSGSGQSVQDTSRLAICLFNKTQNKPVAQSLRFIHKNDQKHCYVTLQTEFWFQCDQSNDEYCPCIVYYDDYVKFSWQDATPQIFELQFYPTFV